MDTLQLEHEELPYKLELYDEYIRWYALPLEAKKEIGMVTQSAFADHYKIAFNTTTAWKRRPDFIAKVRALRQDWGFERTGDVLNGMYKAAVKGNPNSQKLWLQYFEDFTEKSEQTNVNRVEIGVNDIRFIIEQLPEPLKSKHYANLRDLLDDADAVRNAREIEDSAGAAGPTQALPGQADNLPPDVPATEAGAVAEGDTAGVREDMEREV